MKNGRKSTNLVKSHELIFHFIRGYLIIIINITLAIENVKIVGALLECQLISSQSGLNVECFIILCSKYISIIWSQYDLAFSVVSTKNFDFSKVLVDSQKDNLFMFFVYQITQHLFFVCFYRFYTEYNIEQGTDRVFTSHFCTITILEIALYLFRIHIIFRVTQGAFNNYVDKMRGGGEKKMSVFVHSQGIKAVHTGGRGSKMTKFCPRSC